MNTLRLSTLRVADGHTVDVLRLPTLRVTDGHTAEGLRLSILRHCKRYMTRAFAGRPRIAKRCPGPSDFGFRSSKQFLVDALRLSTLRVGEGTSVDALRLRTLPMTLSGRPGIARQDRDCVLPCLGQRPMGLITADGVTLASGAAVAGSKPLAKIVSLTTDSSTRTKMSLAPLVSAGSISDAFDSHAIDSPDALSASV